MTDPHVSDVPGHADAVDHHAPDDHGEAHGHDDHAHGSEPLGPIDVAAWGASLVGIALGLVVVMAFVLATAPVATA